MTIAVGVPAGPRRRRLKGLVRFGHGRRRGGRFRGREGRRRNRRDFSRRLDTELCCRAAVGQAGGAGIGSGAGVDGVHEAVAIIVKLGAGAAGGIDRKPGRRVGAVIEAVDDAIPVGIRDGDRRRRLIELGGNFYALNRNLGVADRQRADARSPGGRSGGQQKKQAQQSPGRLSTGIRSCCSVACRPPLFQARHRFVSRLRNFSRTKKRAKALPCQR